MWLHVDEESEAINVMKRWSVTDGCWSLQEKNKCDGWNGEEQGGPLRYKRTILLFLDLQVQDLCKKNPAFLTKSGVKFILKTVRLE